MATYASVNDRRAQNWWKNAIRYRWMKLFPGDRDKDLWLFSAWEGEKYADNSKYLFEYLLLEHPDIQCIWQTRNASVYSMLKNAGKPVQLIGTEEASEAQRRAGVVLYTNGLDDFGDFPEIYGAICVALWHGVGFKKIYRMLREKNANPLKEFFSNMRWKFFSWVARDITIATSEYNKKQSIVGFNLSEKDRILIAGQARNDVFANKADIADAVANQELIDKIGNRRVILYMPTFREKSEKILEQLKEILKSDRLDRILEKNEAVFIAKLHYLNQGENKSAGNKILLNDSDVLDSQKLLACADVLITDYSSCAVDFALTQRPTLYYFFDWDEYRAEQKMMPETSNACSINCAFTIEDFIEKVELTLTNPEKGLEQSQELNTFFDETGVKPGKFAEDAFLKISKAVGNRER